MIHENFQQFKTDIGETKLDKIGNMHTMTRNGKVTNPEAKPLVLRHSWLWANGNVQFASRG